MTGNVYTEITLEELFSRGLKLPEDRLSFPVEQYEQYRAQLKGKGGVYTFYHEAEGYLYTGVSADLGYRIRGHINGNSTGNKELHEKIQAISGVTVTVYREPDSGKRELYENYLILRYNPVCNRAKVSQEYDGYNLTFPKKIQDKVVRLYMAKKAYKEIEEVVGVSSHAITDILKANGVELDRSRRIDDWTGEAVLQELKDGKKTQAQIAKECGVKQATVSRIKRTYEQLTGDTLLTEEGVQVQERNLKILELYEADMPDKQIAVIVGCTESAVRGVLYRHLKNIAQPGKRKQKRTQQVAQRNLKIIGLWQAGGMTYKQIAEAIGCSYTVVNKAVTAYNKEQQ